MNISHRYRPRVGLAAGAWVALLLAALMPLSSAMAADAAPPPAAASAPPAQSSAPASSAVTAPAPSATSSPAPATPATPAGVPAGAPAPVASPAPTGPPPAAAAPAAAPTGAPPAAPADSTRSLDEQVQDLKKSTLQLNRDLFILEEELLFPANTQVAVFVSVDVGEFFALDSINLKLDNREVSNYLYTPREVSALLKGGVQRIYVGNLKSGTHELVAFFNGKGPNDRYYKRAASIRFEKGVGAKYLELKVTDRAHAQQPEFEIKDWE
jgi:hypothetical protein